jgi:hypothetical protein
LNPKEIVRKSPIEWPWAVIVSVFGLLLAGTAYSLGDAYYAAYLRFFSVESSGFPVDHSTHLIYGVWGGLNATLALQAWISVNAGRLWVTLFGLVVYIAAISFATKGFRKFSMRHAGHAKGVSKYIQKRPHLKMFLFWTTVMILSIAGVILLFQSVTVVASIPSTIGESSGQAVAEKDKQDFDRGCEKSSAKCYMVTKDGITIGQGYVIAQSPQRIALYYRGETSQFELTGVSMKTTRKEPATTQPSAPSKSSATKSS